MKGNHMKSHKYIIRDQFTKQAFAFSSATAIKSEDILKILLRFTNPCARDTVLDVACGPGIVVCAFAAVVAHATGIDLTPAMIERASALQSEKRLMNVTWQVGDIVPLPYSDESFSIVTSRYAFHHMQDPRAVIAEMNRVCRVRGKVAQIDMIASEDPIKADALNRMDRLRDPSHVRALTLAEMRGLFAGVGLPDPRMTFYKFDVELEALLKFSFPNEGDAEKVRQMLIDSLEDDGMGLSTRREKGQIWLSYPIVAMMAEKQKV